jgi:hypothetical protein
MYVSRLSLSAESFAADRTQRANVDVVGVDEFPKFPELVHHGWRSGRKVI